MSEPTHDPELTAVERALAGLAPAPGALDRDALMFAAGQRSVRRGWAWPGAAAGSTLAAVLLGALLLFRPPQEVVVEHVVIREVPTVRETPSPTPDERPAPTEASPVPKGSPLPPQQDYLTLLHQVERRGDAGLPNTTFSTVEEKSASPDNLLDLSPDMLTDPWLQRRKPMLNPGGPL